MITRLFRRRYKYFRAMHSWGWAVTTHAATSKYLGGRRMPLFLVSSYGIIWLIPKKIFACETGVGLSGREKKNYLQEERINHPFRDDWLRAGIDSNPRPSSVWSGILPLHEEAMSNERGPGTSSKPDPGGVSQLVNLVKKRLNFGSAVDRHVDIPV